MKTWNSTLKLFPQFKVITSPDKYFLFLWNNVDDFLGTNYCIPKRWSMGPLQLSLPPWLKPLVTPLVTACSNQYLVNIEFAFLVCFLSVEYKCHKLTQKLRESRTFKQPLRIKRRDYILQLIQVQRDNAGDGEKPHTYCINNMSSEMNHWMHPIAILSMQRINHLKMFWKHE